MSGTEWKHELPMQRLRDAFLAECGDESKAAAKRCKRLRKELAASLRSSLAMTHRPTPLLLANGKRSSTVPGVWVEVRGTAGRNLVDGAFTVGKAPECDVQVWGDDAVLPMHFLVVSLPGGIVVVDAWSGGSTKVIWRHGGKHSEPPPVTPLHVATMAATHKERLVLCVGAHTAVTLGPVKKSCSKEKKRVQACNSSATSPAISPQLQPCEPPALQLHGGGADNGEEPIMEPITKRLKEDDVERMSRTSTSLDSGSTASLSSRSPSPSCRGSRSTHESRRGNTTESRTVSCHSHHEPHHSNHDLKAKRKKHLKQANSI